MSHYNQEVYNKISLVLIDALGVDEDEISPEATLVGNLGAESIDFLDIVYNRFLVANLSLTTF
jgi:acyl carrier protein